MKVEFKSVDGPLNDPEIARVSRQIGLKFPCELIGFYKCFNDGEPDPYVFRRGDDEILVSATLPLSSPLGRRTAVDTYDALVNNKKIVGKAYFPFAVEGGGDYFFVDCVHETESVHYYRSDTIFDSGLVRVAGSLAEFFDAFGPE